ncbi:MptD family putative ECF transporter S component [uncultured Propionibacterium sp.]|uniref:MptD family putative ECF transporter S component n=1 Tax=uncultured Propionibacterium sp. TaxID=218066 RepID=UPI00292FD421|nr:MptD family putative ECF transporter S component [uncultured Propionibacterium sp.]
MRGDHDRQEHYRSTVRTGISWVILSAGMVFGNTIPLWFAWDTLTERASKGGFSQELFDMQVRMVHSPLHIAGAMLISVIGGVLGVLLAHRIMRRHFQRARVVA